MEQPASRSSADQPEYAHGNRLPFGRHGWWVTALLVLLSSATLLLAGFLGYHLTGGGYSEQTAIVLRLRLVLGEGQSVGDSLQIRRLDPQGRAFAAGSIMRLPAESFPVLEWRIDGLTPRAEVLFTWTTSADPTQTRSLPIGDVSVGTGKLRLDDDPHWNQTILTVGLMVRGTLLEPLSIHRLALEPDRSSATALLEQLWSEWTAFEGWHPYSINFIIGGARRDRLLSPTLAAAAWVGLSALLYAGLIVIRRRTWDIKPFILFFFAGWLALDGRWQLDLWRQLEITRETFAGKNWEEKRLAAEDSGLFQFAQTIKEQLTQDPARIFIITHNLLGTQYYRRVRMHYFLLPYNVSAQWTEPPPPAQTRAGDYLLFLYPVEGVTYDQASRTLLWGEDSALTVEPILKSRRGVLFQVR